jgi:hypothetical protein
MVRTKIALLGLCVAVVSMMAMSAGAAHGAVLSWLILNAAHTTATELKAALAAETDTTHLTLDGEVAGLKIAVTCTGIDLVGANLEVGGKLTNGFKFVLLGCKVYRQAPLTEEYKCIVKSPGAPAGTIESGELKGELVLVGAELLIKIEPVAGPAGTFKLIRFEGPECPLPEHVTVHGTLYLKDCQGFMTTHKLKHLFESAAASTALYIGAHSAKQLEVTKWLGSFWVKLAGAHAGLEWSGMDV